MKVEDIEIYTGKPAFSYQEIRRLEVKCEATNALMPAPTHEEANGRLRALAAKAGANAIVEVEYNSGVSFTSWKSLKATGLAVFRESDEATCSVCAETIKRAALKCRYCGADRVPDEVARGEPLAELAGPTPFVAEPLRDNNNPVVLIAVCAAVLLLFMFVTAQS